MGLVELTGAAAVDGGSTTVTVLDSWASFELAHTHDYDDRQNGLGCFADHYDAVTKPLPPDKDAAILRISGYVGGMLVSGQSAGQPVVCTMQNGFYACVYPNGAAADVSSPFATQADPLGSGPVVFDTGSGADFGATFAQSTPVPTLSLQENLASMTYTNGQSAAFHVTCSAGCASSNVSIRLTALAYATEASGFPYPSVGLVRCTVSADTIVTVPAGAISAMYSADARLDTVVSEVFLESSQLARATDAQGNPLYAETGRGVFGISPQAP
jgi:hypothetical protein